MAAFRLFRKGSSKKNEGKIFEALEILGEPTETDLGAIRLNSQTEIVLGIRCGGCGKEWKDAFRPDKETQVTCPFCGGINTATIRMPQEPAPIPVTRVVLDANKQEADDGIQILLDLITEKGILFESDYIQRAAKALEQEGSPGSKRLSLLIRELMVCRSPKLLSILEVAGQVEPDQDLIDVLLEVKNAGELTEAPARQLFSPDIFGDGKVGWGSGTAEKIHRKSVKTLEKLTGAVVTSQPMARPGADLDDADLAGADFSEADLRGASLQGANLEGAILRHARLDEANLEGANLKDANLYFSNLTGANLRGADLRGANLYAAVLKDADLEGADVTGAYGPNLITLPNDCQGGIEELEPFTKGVEPSLD